MLRSPWSFSQVVNDGGAQVGIHTEQEEQTLDGRRLSSPMGSPVPPIIVPKIKIRWPLESCSGKPTKIPRPTGRTWRERSKRDCPWWGLLEGAAHSNTPWRLKWLPRRAPSEIPRPVKRPQGYRRRRAVASPPPLPWLGPSPPQPHIGRFCSQSEEDLQPRSEARFIAKNRKDALAMLEGRIPAKGWDMEDYVARQMAGEFRGGSRPDGSLNNVPFENFRDRQEFGRVWRVLEEKKRKRPVDRSEEIKRKISEVRSIMGRRKNPPQPSLRKPLPPSPPPSPPLAAVPSQAQGNNRVPAKTDSQREEEELAAAIAASIAEAEAASKKHAGANKPLPPLPLASPIHRQQVPGATAPPPTRPMLNLPQPAPAKTAAELEEEDYKKAVAASLADVTSKQPKTWAARRAENRRQPAPAMTEAEREQEDVKKAMAASIADAAQKSPKTWAARRAEARGKSPFRPAGKAGPASPPRATDKQPGYMASTQTWAQRRRAQERSPSRPPRGNVVGRRAPPPATRRVGVGGNPRDPKTGEALSDEAWNAQIL